MTRNYLVRHKLIRSPDDIDMPRFMVAKGNTYNVGNNKRKREEKERLKQRMLACTD